MSTRKPTDTKPVEENRARRIAKQFCPIIHQGFSGAYDCLTPIMLDNNVNKIEKNFVLLTRKPTLYFQVRSDLSYYYAFYMKYHFYDWAESKIPIIGKLIEKWDSHLHDTESILFRINKKNENIDAITIFHHSHLFGKNNGRNVYIESHGHGIIPSMCKTGFDDQNVLTYRRFNFEYIGDMTTKKWEKLSQKMKGVLLPYEQVDRSLLLQTRRSKNYSHFAGDIWYRPDELFKTMEFYR